MRALLLLSCLIFSSEAYFAVDFAQVATRDQMQCLAQAGYSSAFVRAYNPAGNGAYDPNGSANVHNAYPNIGTEVFMTPQPMSTKPGYIQFDEMYTGLKNGGVLLYNAWIQVVSPGHWNNGTTSNIAFIESVLNRMRIYGIRPGIYTSQADWSTITGNWKEAGQDVMLWYVNSPSNAAFSDFQTFGSWRSPTVKQYQQQISVCQLTVNQDVFVSPSPNLAAYLASLKTIDKDAIPEKYVVGMLRQ